MKVAVIPARGGSKRIPRKNIKLFAGLPMIAHSLCAARNAHLFDHIMVSSDDDEILEAGIAWGGETLQRPAALADDHTGTIAVMRHAIEWMEAQGWKPEAVCCIYATAPFVQPEDLVAGHEALVRNHKDFAFAATSFGYPIHRGFVRSGSGVRMLFPEHFATRSQDLPEVLHDAGQFYWGTPEAWKLSEIIFSERATPVMLPRWRVQDIDTEEDWLRAELMWEVLNRRSPKSIPAES